MSHEYFAFRHRPTGVWFCRLGQGGGARVSMELDLDYLYPTDPYTARDHIEAVTRVKVLGEEWFPVYLGGGHFSVPDHEAAEKARAHAVMVEYPGYYGDPPESQLSMRVSEIEVLRFKLAFQDFGSL